MTPEQLAKGGTEHCHQVALMQQCQLMKHLYPELASPLLFAIPNGGSRGDTAQSARIQGGKLKAEGVKPGVSDLFLAVCRGGYAGFFLELKKEKAAGVGPSEAQKDFIGIVQDQGYNAGVYYGWEDAWKALVAYMEMDK